MFTTGGRIASIVISFRQCQHQNKMVRPSAVADILLGDDEQETQGESKT